jgi:hypothetical protein
MMVLVAGLEVPFDQSPVARGSPVGFKVEAGWRMEEVMLGQVALGAGLESQGKDAKEPGVDPSPS